MHHERPDHPGGADASAPDPAPLAALVRSHVLDAELGGLLWLLLDARTPVLVAGPAGSGRRPLAAALEALLPSAAVRLAVRGAVEDFAWLPEARSLGWRHGGNDAAAPVAGARPGSGVLVVRDLADGASGGPDGERARIIVRALSLGYGLVATMQGTRLDDVLERLGAPEIGADADACSRLGVVLVMAPPDPARGPRVAAAHYVRPVALDTHGHVQRPAPAVLATWSGQADRWDHFAWGLLPDLGGRVGRSPIDVEREQARRAAAIATA